MGKPNRFDVTEVVSKQSPATKRDLAEALGVDEGPQLDAALDKASKHGLIEAAPAADDQAEAWKISDKGTRKLASRS